MSRNNESSVFSALGHPTRRAVLAYLRDRDYVKVGDIAEAVGRHETTVSRACTQKYLRTPFGIFELKYFFGSHVVTDTGGHTASGAIRAQIEKLIQQENPHQPLTDTDLTEMLGQRGIQVARRTVAKYRESLNILPAAQRRSR